MASVDQMVMDSAVQTSIKITSKVLGMPESAVALMAKAGMQTTAKLASENPELLKKMYGEAFKQMPEPMQEFYAKLAESPKLQEVTKQDCEKLFGAYGASLNKAVAESTGHAAEEAAAVLANTMPAMLQSFRKASASKDEAGFAEAIADAFA